jgi:hypothetical protein
MMKFLNFTLNINAVQQKKPNQEQPIDLVEQFYKENVDLKKILNKRNARKAISAQALSRIRKRSVQPFY